MKKLSFVYGGSAYRLQVIGDFVKVYNEHGGLLGSRFVWHFQVYDKKAGWNLQAIIRLIDDILKGDDIPF